MARKKAVPNVSKPGPRIAVLDLETDPFEFQKVPQPFVAGFYDGESFLSIWSPDCVAKLVAYLASVGDPLIIFAHNGGKFDYFYFLEYLDTGDMRIVNGRIIQATLGIHQLRDSFAIMPFPLAAYQKDSIDYNKMHADCRESHRDEIVEYLKGDCVYLHQLAVAYFAEFGDKLTVGSAAMTQLKRFHKFDRGKESFDAKFRTDFYFGGRNQCFASGLIRRPLKIYDVNSMYPFVMSSFLHPVSTNPILSTRVERNTCFVVATGHNYGAFPVRNDTGGLDFTVPYGKFSTTIHEWNAALETGCFKPEKIHRTYGFDDRISFGEFVEHFYNERAAAKRDEKEHSKPPMYSLFYKFVLNSAYGKFAQNPENFFEWCITPGDKLLTEVCPICKGTGKDENFRKKRIYGVPVDLTCMYCQGCGFKWTPAYQHQGKYTIWQCPLMRHFYYNVTTGASITGAARAVLMRGLHAAVNPIYCDTDSIICEDLRGVPMDDTTLGAWKLEASGSVAAICGKKLYAVFNDFGECIKKAHKGARLTGPQIKRIALGETIEACNPVPSFQLDGHHLFTKRRMKNTAKNLRAFAAR